MVLFGTPPKTPSTEGTSPAIPQGKTPGHAAKASNVKMERYIGDVGELAQSVSQVYNRTMLFSWLLLFQDLAHAPSLNSCTGHIGRVWEWDRSCGGISEKQASHKWVYLKMILPDDWLLNMCKLSRSHTLSLFPARNLSSQHTFNPS